MEWAAALITVNATITVRAGRRRVEVKLADSQYSMTNLKCTWEYTRQPFSNVRGIGFNEIGLALDGGN